jgi:hypothetical protein
MTETTDSPLDLSVLAQVDSAPTQPDEKPLSTGGAPRGKPADEESTPPTRRRAYSRRNAERPPAQPPSGPREYVREDADPITEYRPGIFVKPITDAYMTGAAIVMPFNQPIATSIMQNAENCAKAWDNAAKVDKRVRKRLMQAMETGIIVPLLIAHFPIVAVAGVVLFPPRAAAPEVQLPEQGPGETINPVSNGFRRPQ